NACEVSLDLIGARCGGRKAHDAVFTVYKGNALCLRVSGGLRLIPFRIEASYSCAGIMSIFDLSMRRAFRKGIRSLRPSGLPGRLSRPQQLLPASASAQPHLSGTPLLRPFSSLPSGARW